MPLELAPITNLSLKSGVLLLPSHNTQPVPVPPEEVEPIKFAAPDQMIIPPEGIAADDEPDGPGGPAGPVGPVGPAGPVA